MCELSVLTKYINDLDAIPPPDRNKILDPTPVLLIA